MRKITPHLLPLSLLAGALALIPAAASAMCPVCALAAGVGIGIAEEFGIDDLVTGLWVGALTVALIGWTVTWLNKKNVHFKGRIILTTIIWFALMVWPLQWIGMVPLHQEAQRRTCVVPHAESRLAGRHAPPHEHRLLLRCQSLSPSLICRRTSPFRSSTSSSTKSTP